MSYRQSSYDPLAYVAGKPKRPFNWVQKIGTGFTFLAVAWLLLYAAGKLGWPGLPSVEVQPATAFALLGIALINSRREDYQLIGEEQMRRNRHWLLATVAVLAAVGGILLAVGGGR